MGTQLFPRYPIYIPSKGRWGRCTTARELIKDHVPFELVVEPQEADAYKAVFPARPILVLPFAGQGLAAARNWIKEHATRAGAARHWQIDDNTYGFYRVYRGVRIPCAAGLALRVVEDFADRYENVAIAGLNYDMFYVPNKRAIPPFYLNHHVYSCTLVLNSLPYKWRTFYNDDADMCLQVLAGGWCTLLVNAFLVKKKRTMEIEGGNTPAYAGDGRLKMARSLERLWPGVVSTVRKFQRPQHVVRNAWGKFDTPLKLKPGLDRASLKDRCEIDLVTVRAPSSEAVRALAARWRREQQRRGPAGSLEKSQQTNRAGKGGR